VRLIFACFTLKQERPTWPHIGYDFAGDIERVTSALQQLCPKVEFLAAVAHGPDDAQQLLAAGVQIASTLHRLPDEQLGAGDADHCGLRQADTCCRFPLRRKRRVPRLYGRTAPHPQELFDCRTLQIRDLAEAASL
jgi:hypothetical protein